MMRREVFPHLLIFLMPKHDVINTGKPLRDLSLLEMFHKSLIGRVTLNYTNALS